MKIPDNILLKVEKPARYIGNELNMVEKDLNDVLVRFAFCFPDVYEVGMSHLGLSILYYFLNEREDTYCERSFAPFPDMEKVMRENNFPLFALETGDALDQFDIIGFTLQYEMSYTNIVNMLDLSNLPLLSKDRGENFPIICAGGPCAYNPEPIADLIDFFYIGEGEVTLNEVMDKYSENKKKVGTKEQFLLSILDVQGVYVPKFYDVEYNLDNTIKSFTPNNPKAKTTITKVMVENVDATFYPSKQLLPLIEVVHDRVAIELFRGCMRGCRFCQAGFVCRPLREKNADTLLKQGEALIDSTGHEEISLVSLSTSDYTQFGELATSLLDKFKDKKVNISLPSLRIDAFTLDIMNQIQGVRKSSLTFAPEAGSQRLRDVINKGLSEEDILNGSALAFSGGWDRVKLYFMIGLPTETFEDLAEISVLAEKIVESYYKHGKKSRQVSVNLSASCFVPKPFTPFQWQPQDTAEMFKEKQIAIKKSIHKKQIKFSYHDPYVSVLEGVMARGDRRVLTAIVKAWQEGARFDGWSEHFKKEAWQQAFEHLEQTHGVSYDFYTHRQRETTEILPWNHIDVGVTKEFFIDEMEKAKTGEVTLNCRENCSLCGVQNLSGGVCVGN